MKPSDRGSSRRRFLAGSVGAGAPGFGVWRQARVCTLAMTVTLHDLEGDTRSRVSLDPEGV